jgi:hypothetical protein
MWQKNFNFDLKMAGRLFELIGFFFQQNYLFAQANKLTYNDFAIEEVVSVGLKRN